MADRSSRSRRAFLGGVGGMLATAGVLPGCASIPDVEDKALKSFIESIEGHVLVPSDGAYEAFRRVQSHNPLTDKRPAIIARCANSADVARSLRFARERDLEIAVRGGGHDVLGQSTNDGGLLVDLGPMLGIQVEDTTVHVGAGVRAGHLNVTLQDRGLVVPLGCHPSVGVAGLTLGGGLGWLLGKYGATCDSVTAMEAITVAGRPIRATVDEEPDLFWALRGGGGNFAVVTSIEYRTRPIDKVVRGFIVYPADQLRAFLAFYDEFMYAAPDDLTVEVVVATAREPLITVTFCYAGAEREAAEVVKPLLSFGPPLAEDVAAVPYARLTDPPEALIRRFFGDGNREEPAAEPGGAGNHWRGASLSAWTDAAIDSLHRVFLKAPVGYSIGIGHFMHGAICRVDDASTPIIRREGSYSYFFNASWRGAHQAEKSMAWVDDSVSSMANQSIPTYVNYLSTNDRTNVAATYGDNYERLRRIKATYDPDNVLHLNRNILPL